MSASVRWGDDGMRRMRLLVADDRLQGSLDILQNLLGAQPTEGIVVLPVEAPCPAPPPETKRTQTDTATAAREALYEGVERSAGLDANFAVLVVLPTVVAAIELIETTWPSSSAPW